MALRDPRRYSCHSKWQENIMSFITIKIINNRHYRYAQTSVRQGKRVWSVMRCFGPVESKRKKCNGLFWIEREPVVWIDPETTRALEDPEGYKAQQERRDAKYRVPMNFFGIKEGPGYSPNCKICREEEKAAPPQKMRPRLLQRQKINLLLIHQRRQHLQLLSRDAFGAKADGIPGAVLKGSEHLHDVGDRVQFAFLNTVAVEDGGGRIEVGREQEPRRLLLRCRYPAIGEKRAIECGHRNRDTAAQDAFGRATG
jgi:hypothetical protein